jgi:hypothetical protein
MGMVSGTAVAIVGGVFVSWPVIAAGASIATAGYLMRKAGKRFWAKHAGAREFAGRFEGK